ncbi:TrkA C-terminal domain-containing protein [Peptoniphilus vaginalis]|uniref:TrkA C-terminal domain-containing protein n=1 Tax=Peptoniphilus vaginalis TaxID=1756987 RepID=UPI0023F8DAB9|nr:TrkA C-terminal domain-containing protein [Peptoniphilus vaginalis]
MGTALPFATKKVDMYDPDDTVLRTFNVIIAKIERDKKSIVPRGNTLLKSGDRAIISRETKEIEDPAK